MGKDLRATWPQALATFLAPILLIVSLRWIFIEPFVVPSGSMIPTLLEHDHILANKVAYGIHWPFSRSWMLHWSNPRRGQIAVFHYPKSPEVYFVKRIVAIPGDKVSVDHGILSINGQPLEQTQMQLPVGGDDRFQYFQEANHVIRYLDRDFSNFHALKVPEGQYFAMGDNRDQSSDSRVWGFVPEENFVGSVVSVWLSCEKTLPSASYLCDPSTLRWNRLLIGVQ